MWAKSLDVCAAAAFDFETHWASAEEVTPALLSAAHQKRAGSRRSPSVARTSEAGPNSRPAPRSP
eukprot:2526525-Alexandrium_andersonii.AAC.1